MTTPGDWDDEQADGAFRPFVNDDQSGVERDAFGRDDRGRRAKGDIQPGDHPDDVNPEDRPEAPGGGTPIPPFEVPRGRLGRGEPGRPRTRPGRGGGRP